MNEIKRDTAVFGPQQFYIEGVNGIMFTTEADAVNALHVAAHLVEDEKDRLRNEIMSLL